MFTVLIDNIVEPVYVIIYVFPLVDVCLRLDVVKYKHHSMKKETKQKKKNKTRREQERELSSGSTPEKKTTYIGITENEFQTRYNQHTSSFRLNHKKKTATTLSEFVWKLKESNTEYHISWDIIERAQPYSAVRDKTYA